MLTLLQTTCFYKDIPEEYIYCALPTYFLVKDLFNNFYSSQDSLRCSGILGCEGILLNHLCVQKGGSGMIPVKVIEKTRKKWKKKDVQFAGLICRQWTRLLTPLKLEYLYDTLKSMPDLDHLYILVVYGSFDLTVYYVDRDYLTWYENQYGNRQS